MNNYDQPDTDQELGAYALSALDLADRPAVEARLAASPELQEELRQLRDVVALLPYAAPPVAPPDRVRQQLMARVAASQSDARPAPGPAPALSRRGPAWFMPALAGLVVALVLALGGLTLALTERVATLDRTNSDLVTTLDSLQRTLAATRTRQDELAASLVEGQSRLERVSAELAASDERISRLSAERAQDEYVIEFVSAPGVATRRLTPAAGNESAQGEMYMYPGNSQAVVLFSGLPTLAPGEVYQFWLADGDTQVAGGTFVVEPTGIGHIVVQAPREVDAFRQVMITVEPRGGSAAPSDTVVLEGNL